MVTIRSLPSRGPARARPCARALALLALASLAACGGANVDTTPVDYEGIQGVFAGSVTGVPQADAQITYMQWRDGYTGEHKFYTFYGTGGSGAYQPAGFSYGYAYDPLDGSLALQANNVIWFGPTIDHLATGKTMDFSYTMEPPPPGGDKNVYPTLKSSGEFTSATVTTDGSTAAVAPYVYQQLPSQEALVGEWALKGASETKESGSMTVDAAGLVKGTLGACTFTGKVAFGEGLEQNYYDDLFIKFANDVRCNRSSLIYYGFGLLIPAGAQSAAAGLHLALIHGERTPSGELVYRGLYVHAQQ